MNGAEAQALEDVVKALEAFFAEGIDRHARRGIPLSQLVLVISDGSLEEEGPDVRTVGQMRRYLQKLRRKGRHNEVQDYLRGRAGAVRLMMLARDEIKLSWVDARKVVASGAGATTAGSGVAC